jgi:hypothetical protein
MRIHTEINEPMMPKVSSNDGIFGDFPCPYNQMWVVDARHLQYMGTDRFHTMTVKFWKMDVNVIERDELLIRGGEIREMSLHDEGIAGRGGCMEYV